MQWRNNGYKNVYDAIKANTGRAEEFLHPPERPYPVQNLDVMGAWIRDYISYGVVFTIIGDYDCDGICATAGLYLLLQELGAMDVRMRLPRRMSEGYGLSESIVDEISSGVVITVDNGIAANEAVAKAKDKGLRVMVLDHHLPRMQGGRTELPDADLIVDPHVPDQLIQKGALVKSAFDGYCGAGLVYKLAQKLIPGTVVLKRIAAFAAIATVADVVPLVEDNRNIYHDGLQSIFEKEVTPGLQALLDLLGSDNRISETDIGFKIAPMLNAPGRLYDNGADIALRAVLAGGPSKAEFMAEQLTQINEARKSMKEAAVQRAFQTIKEDGLKKNDPIVIFDPETSEGVVGLVAGAITEEYHVSSIVFTETGYGLKGSARAADYDNIKEALDGFNEAHPGILMKYGGHKAAAGLSIRADGLHAFADGMQKFMGPAQAPPKEVCYDIETTPKEVWETAAEVRRFAPFGEGNPPILVRINGFRSLPQGNSFYKELKKDTVKLLGTDCEAVGFSLMERFQQEGRPTYMDIVGKLGFRYANGKCTAQIEIIDLKARAAQREQNRINLSIADRLKQFGLS